MKQEAGGKRQEMIKHYKDLDVYKLSYSLALEIFKLSKGFPKEEMYSLTGQIIRSSRSIPANIAEGWSRRKHVNIFKKHLTDSMGSTDETKTWLDFAKDCGYLATNKHEELITEYESVGAKLYNLHDAWRSL